MAKLTNNRYQLLFLEEDITDPYEQLVIKNKKPSKTVGGNVPSAKSTNRPNIQSTITADATKNPKRSEKENKPSELNKKSNLTTIPENVSSKQVKTAGNANRKQNGAGDGQNEQQPKVTERQKEAVPVQQPRQNLGPQRNRNFENFNRGGKGEFDRQSGFDKNIVKGVDKRNGAGAYNCGSLKETIDDVIKGDTEGINDTDKNGEKETTIEVETKSITWDEWKAQKQERAKPIYNIRKAGEGEDTSQWKKMVILKKKKGNESDDEMEFDPSLYPQRVGRQRRVLNIQFNFKDGPRGGGMFAGRGRGRGSRPINHNDNWGNNNGRNNNRDFGRSDEQPQKQVPKVTDERQFPTLGPL